MFSSSHTFCFLYDSFFLFSRSISLLELPQAAFLPGESRPGSHPTRHPTPVHFNTELLSQLGWMWPLKTISERKFQVHVQNSTTGAFRRSVSCWRAPQRGQTHKDTRGFNAGHPAEAHGKRSKRDERKGSGSLGWVKAANQVQIQKLKTSICREMNWRCVVWI